MADVEPNRALRRITHGGQAARRDPGVAGDGYILAACDNFSRRC